MTDKQKLIQQIAERIFDIGFIKKEGFTIEDCRYIADSFYDLIPDTQPSIDAGELRGKIVKTIEKRDHGQCSFKECPDNKESCAYCLADSILHLIQPREIKWPENKNPCDNCEGTCNDRDNCWALGMYHERLKTIEACKKAVEAKEKGE